ncbi:MAG: tRNA (cytidine(34)-2'-O)-methyltransferase [Proteobacteria bacterium]|nr:tRNA (cytidine(34)-2'-O)-methyltransferase [Pseudomonadota bacterium]
MTIPIFPPSPEIGTPADRHFHVILVEPEIPPNTGTIARLCAGTATHLHLVKPLAFELSDTKLKRAGLDYWPNVHLSVHESFDEIAALFPPEKMHLFTTKTPRKYTDAHYSVGDALIFGPETRGLSQEIRDRFEAQCVTIPIRKDNIRSLNLAVSTSIGLYEALRQAEFAPILMP